jgi:hypothetical protein
MRLPCLPYRPADRRNCSPAALAQKDLEIAKAEVLYREVVFGACRRLVERFGQPTVSESQSSD